MRGGENVSLIQPHLKEFWPIRVTEGGEEGTGLVPKQWKFSFRNGPFKGQQVEMLMTNMIQSSCSFRQ